MATSLKRYKYLTICLAWALSLLLPRMGWAEMSLSLPVEADIMMRYESFLEEKGVPPVEITDLKSEFTNRHVADLIIIQQALHAAGLPVQIDFIEIPNSARERMMVRNGDVVMSGQELFSLAITDDVFMSSAIIPKGAFVKGVYGMKQNALLKTVTSLDELQQFRAVSSTAWKVDWLTLKEMNLKELRNVPRGEMMFILVANRKADFALLEFSANEDMSTTLGDVTLYPVPGVKVGLVDSRHFTVSKLHPDGPKVYEALEKGLAVLRERGVIDKYFRQVGFYNEAVKDWTLINP